MAEDSCGLQTTCTQTITIDDQTPPEITCPADTTVECVTEVPEPDISLVTATDNCGTPTVTFVSAAYPDSSPSLSTRTYMAEDSCGLQTTCTQTITIDDQTPPEITCPADTTLECVTEVPEPDISLVTATDNCGTPTVTFVSAAYPDSSPSLSTRTYMAEDSCGLQTTCTQTITIDDQTPPEITCPADTTLECVTEVPEPDISLVTATDNCGTPTVTFVSDAYSGSCPTIITRTYMAEDSCGLQTTCTQTITIDDQTPPEITCPADTTVECVTEVPEPDISLVTATDNCGTPTVTFVSDAYSGSCPTIITRTYMAEDSCGLQTTCTQTITIDDQTPPEITCPADTTVECVTEVPEPDISLVTATDNCGTPTVTFVSDAYSGSCPTIITRTYMAEDSCGLQTTCTQTITIDDQTPPEITCPADTTVECVTEVPEPDISLVTATDNCGTPTVTFVSAAYPDSSPSLSTRTYMAEDSCGLQTTCTQTITIDDQTPPEITCPADTTLECVTEVPEPDISLVTATDNCGTPTVTFVSDAYSGSCPTIITRTYMAEDSCGLQTTCTQTITIDDQTPPEITCPADTTVECVTEVPEPDISLVTATDNCGTPTVTFVSDAYSGSCPTIITRTYMAEDSCGLQTTCTQTITIDDQTPPEITCPADTTVECVTEVPEPDISLVTATDNCGTPTVTFVSDAYSGSCPTIITRTYMAEDSCGLQTTCTQTITIDDQTPPEITCPADTTVECVTEVPEPDISLVTATDNCGTPTVTFVSDAYSGSCPTIITRTYMAEDSCGLQTTCTQTITIDDQTPPEITCPADTTLECVTEVPEPDISLVTATDNCGTPTVTFVSDAYSGSCPTIITRTYMAEDSCGLQTTCTQTITIDDQTPPEITCPADTTLECVTEVPEPDISLVTATDNCGTPTVTFVSDAYSGSCPTIITRTYMAEDSCGLQTTCTQTITIDDQTPPEITCPADTTVECVTEVPEPDISLVTATDNCGTPTVTFVSDAYSGSCPTIITRTYMAEDSCGLQTTCTQTITIDDQTPPEITCPADTTVECVTEVPEPDISLVTATDNCGTPTVTFVSDAYSGSCPTIITRTYMAEDSCGLQTTCTQTITIDDQTPPEITCPADTTLECVTEVPEPDISLVTATDNCGTPTVTFVSDAYSGSCPTIITRTYMAEDSCGLQTTCTQTITIDDQTPPEITCPADTTVECVTEVPEPDISLVTATDNCGTPTVTFVSDAYSGSCPTIITRTYMAEDSCGLQTTCTQTITIDDQTPPEITCPADTTLECVTEVPEPDISLVTATDNCGTPTVTFVSDAYSGSCPTIITRTYMAEDSCGLQTTCTQTITIDDQTPPEITCPADTTVECVTEVPEPDISLVTATDNCGTPTVTFVSDAYSGSCPTIITRTYMAEDSCGLQTTCTQTITIDDQTPPEITCPADTTVECVTEVPEPDISLVTATDNCGTPTVTFVSDAYSGSCPTIITRTYMAEDSCGLQTTCTQTITIDDQTPPEITCPADTTLECVTEVPEPDISLVTATDNCGTPTVTFVSDAYSGSCPTIITRTYMAEDSCGLQTTCTQTITIDDQTPPEITCPADTTVECVTEVPEPDISLVTATDNCGTPTVTFVSDAYSGSCPTIITRTYMAEDSCGLQTTCTQTITIDDQTPPEITCPADTTVECVTEVPEPDISLVTATDNCGTPTVTFVSDAYSGSCPTIITRTYMAEDSCGLQTTCTQTITIDDQTPPEITCPAD